MNYKRLKAKVKRFLDLHEDTLHGKLAVLREILSGTDRGKAYQSNLIRGSLADIEANEMLVDICDELIRELPRYQQLTIFDYLDQRGGGVA